MLQSVRRFICDEDGEDLIEYGLLAAFVAGIALAVIINDSGGIRTSLRATYQKAADVLDGSESLRSP